MENSFQFFVLKDYYFFAIICTILPYDFLKLYSCWGNAFIECDLNSG